MRRLALALAAMAVFPAAAEASRFHFGSNLKAPVNHAVARPTDTAFWAKKLPGGLRIKAPAKGRIAAVKIKGIAVQKGSVRPNNLFHFQTLRHYSGKLRVKFTSGPMYLPIGGDPNRITTFHPENLCVRKGDYVTFSDVGGYKPGSYGKGTPFKIFSNVPGANTNYFTPGGAINAGQAVHGHPHSGVELMMRMALVTGDQAGVCH